MFTISALWRIARKRSNSFTPRQRTLPGFPQQKEQTENQIRSPGLMTGVAGIGYQLLRLANPQEVPSVLVFNHVGVSEISDDNESHFFRHSAACAGLPHAL